MAIFENTDFDDHESVHMFTDPQRAVFVPGNWYSFDKAMRPSACGGIRLMATMIHRRSATHGCSAAYHGE